MKYHLYRNIQQQQWL